jgi:hypothetical protein
MVQA